MQQSKNARAWLAAEAGLPEASIGLIGFCFGGGYALAAGSGWGAVSTNYGVVPSPRAMRGIGPVIGCYGGRDRQFRGTGEKLKKRLAEVGVVPEVHELADAGHSFLTDGHHPWGAFFSPQMAIGDYPEAREEGWKKIFAFLDASLSASA